MVSKDIQATAPQTISVPGPAALKTATDFRGKYIRIYSEFIKSTDFACISCV